MRLIINSLHQRAEKFIYYCLSKELSIFNLLMAEIFPFVEREAIHIISRKISDAASHVNIMQILIRSQVISETLLPGDLPRFMSNCWFESPVINDETPIVIINPLNGIVTQKRLLSGIEMLKKNPDKIVFSVSHLHHNSHPAWLLETDCVSFSDLFDETENGIPVAFNRKKHIREPFEKYFPSPENIKGSQNLSPLYVMDETIICFRFALMRKIMKGQSVEPVYDIFQETDSEINANYSLLLNVFKYYE